jgi:undecaprenyl-diphosphatase
LSLLSVDWTSVDVSILRALYSANWPPAWLTAAIVLSTLGSGWMMLGLVPWLAVRKSRAPTVAAIATLVSTSAAVTLLKAVTGRVRPCNAMDWCRSLPIDVPVDHSFPSGHAAGSFAFAVFVSRLDRRAAWFAFPLATLVAVSRVALGVHYPTDVLCGALLGSAIGWVGSALYERRLLSSP